MEIKNIKEYNADYHKDGTLVWKKIGEKTGRSGKHRRTKRNYPPIHIGKIVTDGSYTINEDILQQSREMYTQTKEMIPVFLSFDFKLIGGFEQYELAKELGIKKIPAKRITKPNRGERKAFMQSVTNRKLGSKKYPVSTIDGDKIYLNLKRFKIVNNASRFAQKHGYTLDILPDFTFRVWNNGKCILGSPQSGIQFNQLNRVFKLGNTISQ